MSFQTQDVKPKKLLGYPLTTKQEVLVNYLVPSIGACILYIFLFSSEVGLVHRHFANWHKTLAWWSLAIMYLPAVVSNITILSCSELWPERKFGGKKNLLWLCQKTAQHFFFPISSLWRFAERIFWSIEAYRSEDEESKQLAIQNATTPRTIELYMFLQAFLHSLPQILFQLYLLMRHSHTTDKQTAHSQFMSIIFNLTKLAITVTYYQRFKTQKLAGAQYPWYKSNKYQKDPNLSEVILRKKPKLKANLIARSTKGISDVSDNKIEEDLYERPVNRRSSDLYLEPDIRGTYLPPYSSRVPSMIHQLRRMSRYRVRTSISEGTTSSAQPDFNIRRVLFIKGLPEDDLAGKLISFCWWSAFLLARILAILAFQYFYPVQVLYILVSHFILTLAILCYDAKSNSFTRSKVLFFLFVCYIYLFCIIEFKIKFKKAKFIYYGFFTLVYLENFVMCLVWWYGDLEYVEEEFWFKYMFNIIVICSLFSFVSMVFYMTVNKPDKVIVGQVVL
ncbi:uncharacterized protein LOC123311049 [Coccinella septempunctata]|uniref:uncharacterized protein LOC123311049 n=1 Tax=Coccinella septempunctata TaxID=41139 RepID=UPI001D05CD9E|nr:uncharacterized protein LOC123311049 [Coccinella septempunctata]